MRLVVVGVIALSLVGCTSEEKLPVAVDTTPLPTVAAPPYLCDHVPLRAVELMTGVRQPAAFGDFNLSFGDGTGIGSCHIYQPTGEKKKLLDVDLSPKGGEDWVRSEIEAGGKPLPEIVPGGIGFYTRGGTAAGDGTVAGAVLVRGRAQLFIGMSRGAEGRDGATDVIALMKLIAPRLLTEATDPDRSED